jgi:N-acetylglucosamine-6-phosphate deacetylase
LNKISGKIINHNESFLGEVVFDENFIEISKISSHDQEQIIIPGFIDLHCHGGMNHDTMQGIASIKKMSEFHLLSGTTTLLPTTWTNTFEKTFDALDGFNDIFLNNDLSNVFGVHLEGPFINPNKLGAQPPFAQTPSINFIKEIDKISKVEIVTIAPELNGSDKVIECLSNLNIKIQFGHSLADYSCCKSIMSKHSVGFTHLYNAMSGNDHRNPGVLTAALNDGEYAEIICDLHHVSEPAIKIAHKCIPKLYAITDSIGAAGMPNGLYDFANVSIEKKDDLIVLKDTSTLAGSVINMHSTFINLYKMNFSLQEAVAMTSYNAAQYINKKDLGIIRLNAKANILVLDKNLNLKEIYLNGKKINE